MITAIWVKREDLKPLAATFARLGSHGRWELPTWFEVMSMDIYARDFNMAKENPLGYKGLLQAEVPSVKTD